MKLTEATKQMKLTEATKQVLLEGHLENYPTDPKYAARKGNIHTREVYELMRKLGYKNFSTQFMTQHSEGTNGRVYGEKDGFDVTVDSYAFPEIRISVRKGSYGSKHDEAHKVVQANSREERQLLRDPATLLEPADDHALLGATITEVKPRGYDADRHLCKIKLTNGQTLNVVIDEQGA